ncbi:MAG: energy transducer TonB [Bacteroidales bacterium]|nr:energy transducer TonB [Bacteroidales bacterium]
MKFLLKIIFTLAVFLICNIAFSQTSNDSEKVSNVPKLNKKNEKYINFLQQNMLYPPLAHKQNIQGEVEVQFTVAKDGSIRDIIIKKPCHPILDSTAMIVMRSMPKWKPAKLNGKKVDVVYSIPINFAIPKLKTKKQR